MKGLDAQKANILAARTVSNILRTSLGPKGAFRTRCRFSRLGYGRDLVFRVTVTDAVEMQMLSAMLDAEEGDL